MSSNHLQPYKRQRIGTKTDADISNISVGAMMALPAAENTGLPNMHTNRPTTSQTLTGSNYVDPSQTVRYSAHCFEPSTYTPTQLGATQTDLFLGKESNLTGLPNMSYMNDFDQVDSLNNSAPLPDLNKHTSGFGSDEGTVSSKESRLSPFDIQSISDSTSASQSTPDGLFMTGSTAHFPNISPQPHANYNCPTNYQSTHLESSNPHIMLPQRNELVPHELHRENLQIQPTSDQKVNTTSSGADTSECMILQEAEEAFNKFAPSLRKVTAHNVCGFLVECLQDYHQHIPLDDLFYLLYINNDLNFESPVTTQLPLSETPKALESRRKGLKFCSVILQTFHNPTPTAFIEAGLDPKSPLSSVNFHELLRSFLAIKILFSSVQKVEDLSTGYLTVSRLSLYKVYYILCQKLIKKYPAISSSASESICLGQSKIGKLTNLVYPNIVSKRLGRRGESKSHYIGFTWNNSIVGPDILQLEELELFQIKEYFDKKPIKTQQQCKSTRNAKIPAGPHKNIPKFVDQPSFMDAPMAYSKPAYSYVDLSFTYPQSDCSPRKWKTTPNKVPPQSSWANDRLKKSLNALKLYNVSLEPFILDFQAGKFGDENDAILSETVFRAMVVLSDASAKKEAFMHLYLVVLLLILPVALASDEEVSVISKIQLRNSICHCATKLDYELSHLASADPLSLKIFTKVSRKIASLMEMSSCKIKAEYAERVLKEMVRDLKIAGNVDQKSPRATSPLEDTYINSIILSMNAYNFKTINEITKTDEDAIILTISKLAKIFQKTVMSTNDDMSRLPLSADGQRLKQMPQDVPYQVFKLAVRDFHEITLANLLVLKLPMVLIAFIMLHKSNAMQYSSFHDFGKRDPELSKETFKAWWIFSSMYQEYMSVSSEVVALSKTLETCCAHSR